MSPSGSVGHTLALEIVDSAIFHRVGNDLIDSGLLVMRKIHSHFRHVGRQGGVVREIKYHIIAVKSDAHKLPLSQGCRRWW